MRKENSLITLLRNLIDELEVEIERNPRLGLKLEALVTNGTANSSARDKLENQDENHRNLDQNSLPDVHKEWVVRGPHEFRIWLRREPVPVLKAIIRQEDLDAARRASRWKDPEKLADFIAEGLKARMSRGSAFMSKTAQQSGQNASAEDSLAETSDLINGVEKVGSKINLENENKENSMKSVSTGLSQLDRYENESKPLRPGSSSEST